MMNRKVFFQNFVKTVLLLCIMGISLFSWDVLAASSPTSGSSGSLFSNAYKTLYTTFTNARTVVYVTAGFGLVGFAVAAIFGKLSFRWLAMIAIALFALALAEKIVNYTVDAGKGKITSEFAGEVGVTGFKINTGADATTLFDNPQSLYHSDSSFTK